MGEAQKRRWFRFSLRTLFLVVTVSGASGGWIQYQRHWIKLRHEFVDNPPTEYFHAVRNAQPAPWNLRLFGEGGWEVISIRFVPWTEPEPDLSEEQLARYRRLKHLFPEAIISTSPLDSRRPKQLRQVP